MSNQKARTLAIGLCAIFLGALSCAQGLEVDPDPYSKPGSFVRKGLPVQQGAILPDIVAAYTPTGNILANVSAKDVRDAPDVGALEAIIVFMAQAFMGKETAGETGRMLWKMAMALTAGGLLISGFTTFKSVSQGKTGPGEAIVSYLLKATVCIGMLTWVCANIPPLLIGISNAVTKGIDDWAMRKGGEGTKLIETMHATKMSAGITAAGVLVDIMAKTATDAAKANPELAKAVSAAITRALNDQDIKDATSKTANWTNGLAEAKRRYAAGNSSREIGAAIEYAASLPMNNVYERFLSILDQEMSKATKSKTASEPILEAVAKAPQGVDISGFTMPDRLVATYAYIAFAYLGLSIWGMGFASLIWAVLYSLPNEWNLNGVLFAGLKGGLAIILAICLVSIYVGTGLNWQTNKSEQLVDDAPSMVQANLQHYATTVWEVAKAGHSVITGQWAHKQAAAISASMLGGGGVGSVLGQAFGKFTGMTLEQFIIGMLILTAPAQAALMMKGANGIGEHAKTALHAQGAASQSIPGVLGMQAGSSGARLGDGGTIQSLMANRSWMDPRTRTE
jgi:hypothetical protein